MSTLISDMVTAGRVPTDLNLDDSTYATQAGTGDLVLATKMRQFRKFLRPDFAPPLAASFSGAVNDGTPAVASDTASGLVINVGAASGSTVNQALRVVTRSIVGATWHATTRMKPTVNGKNYSAGVLILGNTTNTKMFEFGFRGGGVNTGIEVNRLDSPTAFLDTPYGIQWPPHIDWLKVTYDGANLNFYISADGVLWNKVYAVAATTYMTVVPNVIGLGVNALGGDASVDTPLAANILYYEDSGLAANY